MPASKLQLEVNRNPTRFKVVCCGRRFGKTTMAIAEMLEKASPVSDPPKQLAYIMPTYRQIRGRIWGPVLTHLFKHRWTTEKLVSRTDIAITLLNGNKLIFRSASNYDTLRSEALDHATVDEAVYIEEQAWTEVLRPMLADKRGSATFISSPSGYDWFHGLYERGHDDNFPNWQSWKFKTLDGGFVAAAEIEEARLDLDELSFKQEFEADFINFAGQCYYNFVPEETVVKGLSGTYDRSRPLILMLDFNVAPGVAAIGQMGDVGDNLPGLNLLKEIYVPRNSTTPRIMELFFELYPKHLAETHCYGDATGRSRSSKAIQGSDWDLVGSRAPGEGRAQLPVFLPAGNPLERSRVNAVNSMLKNVAGERRIKVDADCVETIKDFNTVRLGDDGKIDKSDLKRTHLTDAIGYYIHFTHPIIGPSSITDDQKVRLPMV